jgi:NAD+ diphosphatase
MPFADVAFTFCPRCGAHTLRRVRAGLLSCSSCGLEFFTNVASAVVALLRTPDGRILFTRRDSDPGRGLLDLPGGFVDPGESAETALRRELREELGLTVGRISWLGSEANEYEYKGITYRTLDLLFRCEAADLPSVKPLEEIQEILLLRPEEIRTEEIAFASIRTMLRKLL